MNFWIFLFIYLFIYFLHSRIQRRLSVYFAKLQNIKSIQKGRRLGVNKVRSRFIEFRDVCSFDSFAFKFSGGF